MESGICKVYIDIECVEGQSQSLEFSRDRKFLEAHHLLENKSYVLLSQWFLLLFEKFLYHTFFYCFQFFVWL